MSGEIDHLWALRELEWNSTGASEGVRIARVASLSARQAGLNAGDVVLQVGKTPVATPSEFEAALKGVKAGDRVRLLVRNAQSTGLVTVVAG